LPELRRQGIEPAVIAGTGPLVAADVARRFRAGEVTTDIDAVLADSRIDAVMITTRHDSHAALAARALRAGKNVYVEKPLCTTSAQLEEVCAAYNASSHSLMVGFNRRFAPFVKRLKNAL